MYVILNIIWFILGGAAVAIAWLAMAVVFSLTIIGLPIARACFEFSKLSAFPFGKKVVRVSDTEIISGFRKFLNFLINIIWFPFGVVFTVIYFALGIFSIITIVGVPVGIVYLKMGKFVLFPMGARVVEKSENCREYDDDGEDYYD